MFTPWWQTLLYVIFKPIFIVLNFLIKNIIAGISSFIQKTTISILTILIGAGICTYMAMGVM